MFSFLSSGSAHPSCFQLKVCFNSWRIKYRTLTLLPLHARGCSCTYGEEPSPLLCSRATLRLLSYPSSPAPPGGVDIICPALIHLVTETIGIEKCSVTFLSCLSSLPVNSVRISRKARLGGAPPASLGFSRGLAATRIPSLCRLATASRFFRASNPKLRLNLFASSLMAWKSSLPLSIVPCSC